MKKLELTISSRATYGCDIPGEPKDYIEVTEWVNGEGITVEIFRHSPNLDNSIVNLTWGMMDALKTIFTRIDEEQKL